MTFPSLVKTLALQTVIVGAMVMAYIAYDSDAIYEWLSGDVAFGTTSTPCDLHQETCEGHLPDNTLVHFSITPQPIPVMTPLHFQVTMDDIPLDTLKIEMYGLNMNMGRYTYTLSRGADGAFHGEGMIPSCVAQMQWRANIIAEFPTQRVGTYFTFTTE